MTGLLFSLLAGIAVTLQGVFNARLSEKAGFWLTNTWVHGTGLLISLVIYLLVRDGNWAKMLHVNKLAVLARRRCGRRHHLYDHVGISLLGTA